MPISVPEVQDIQNTKKIDKSLDKANIQRLITPLAGLPHSVIGGSGMVLHGFDRPTSDVDVLVSPENLNEALNRMTSAHAGSTIEPIGNEFLRGFLIKIPNQDGEPFEVDIGVMQQDAEDAEYMGDALHSSPNGLMNKPWLFALKLMANREKDLPDVMRLYRAMTPEERLTAKKIIKQRFPNALEDLKMVILMNKMPHAVAKWVNKNCKFAKTQ